MAKITAPRKKNVQVSRAKGIAAWRRVSAWMRQHFYVTIVLTAILGVGLACLVPRAYAAIVASNSDTAARQMAGRHFLLPDDERPAVITVTNANSLGIPFLDGAEDGDKVLIYQENQLAVLYRPSIDKVITVGPLTE